MPPKGWKKPVDQGEEVMSVQSEIRHAVLYLDRQNQTVPEEARFSAKDLNLFIDQEFFSQGWQLFHVQSVDVNPTAIGLLYIFVR